MFWSVIHNQQVKIFQNNKKLNLILISIDTLRPDHMGVYGYMKNTTPNIDKWAEVAYVFTNVVTPVAKTYPSIVGLMTGLHPLNTKIFVNHIEDDSMVPLGSSISTIAKILKKNNYKTAAFVSTLNLNYDTHLNEGFDLYNYADYLVYKNKGQYQELLNSAYSWLEKENSKPFFYWVHLIDPHAPYWPPIDKRCKFDKRYCSVLQNSKAKTLDDMRRGLMGCRENAIPEDKLNLYQTLYDGEIANADSIFQNIMNIVKIKGLDKNSIVILYGDHGEGFDHNYYFSHGEMLYNSNVLIPLIISLPQITTKGNKISRLVENTDIVPTLLDLLNISKEKTKFDGISFSDIFSDDPLIKKQQNIRRYSYLIEGKNLSKYAIYDGRNKYIYSADGSCVFQGQKEELYDLDNDPEEQVNILADNIDLANNLKSNLFGYISNFNLSKSRQDKRKIPVSSQILEELKSLGY